MHCAWALELRCGQFGAPPDTVTRPTPGCHAAPGAVTATDRRYKSVMKTRSRGRGEDGRAAEMPSLIVLRPYIGCPGCCSSRYQYAHRPCRRHALVTRDPAVLRGSRCARAPAWHARGLPAHGPPCRGGATHPAPTPTTHSPRSTARVTSRRPPAAQRHVSRMRARPVRTSQTAHHRTAPTHARAALEFTADDTRALGTPDKVSKAANHCCRLCARPTATARPRPRPRPPRRPRGSAPAHPSCIADHAQAPVCQHCRLRCKARTQCFSTWCTTKPEPTNPGKATR